METFSDAAGRVLRENTSTAVFLRATVLIWHHEEWDYDEVSVHMALFQISQ